MGNEEIQIEILKETREMNKNVGQLQSEVRALNERIENYHESCKERHCQNEARICALEIEIHGKNEHQGIKTEMHNLKYKTAIIISIATAIAVALIQGLWGLIVSMFHSTPKN